MKWNKSFDGRFINEPKSIIMKKTIAIICLLTFSLSYAQWTPETDVNTIVASPYIEYMGALGTSDGQSYVLFWRNIAPPPSYVLEPRLQVIDANGYQKLGSEGILVSEAIPLGPYLNTWDIKIDAEDNLYIGLNGTEVGNLLYLFKMDINGNHLWDVNNANIGIGNKMTMMPRSDGGVIVGWMDNDGAVMQRYDNSGTEIWPAPKVIAPDLDDVIIHSFYELSDGGLIAIVHNRLSWMNSNLYAQRYDADGNEMWPSALQISDEKTAWDRVYEGLQDGDVVYIGYHASVDNGFESFLQRINPDGTLPWGLNGSRFSTDPTYYKMETTIAFETGADHIWAISSFRTSSEEDVGEYVQKFNKNTGERLLTDHAKEIFPVGSDKRHDSVLWIENDNALFLIRDGFDNGFTPVNLQAVALDENGDFYWEEETRPMATYRAPKTRVNFLRPANNQSVVVFVENKGYSNWVYAQNLIHGTAGIEEVTLAPIFISNPIKEEMIIQSDAIIQEVSVFNIIGQQILKSSFLGENTININTNHWTSGMYIVQIQTENRTKQSFKVIKQ